MAKYIFIDRQGKEKVIFESMANYPKLKKNMENKGYKRKFTNFNLPNMVNGSSQW